MSGNDARSAAAVSDVVWEDATTLLATVTQGNEQYVVGATIDGRVERVVGRPPRQMSTEYRFPATLLGDRGAGAQPICRGEHALDDSSRSARPSPLAKRTSQKSWSMPDRAEALEVHARAPAAGHVVERRAVDLDVVEPSGPRAHLLGPPRAPARRG